MKNFFTDWLTFTFIIAIVWFGGRGMGYINLDKTFEEQVRVAAMAEIEPEQIEILKIEGMRQNPPTLSAFELKAPTARLGRLKIRFSLWFRIFVFNWINDICFPFIYTVMVYVIQLISIVWILSCSLSLVKFTVILCL